MDGSIGFSTAQSVPKNPENLFTIQNIFYIIFWTSRKYFLKKMQFYEFKKKYPKWLGYLWVLLNTHFIPLQIEASPILVSPKLGEP